MASRTLEIALKLFVEGGGDIKTLGQQVQAFKRELDKVDGNATLDKLFKKGVTDIDVFIKRVFELQRQLGKAVKFDINISTADAALKQLNSEAERFSKAMFSLGKQKLDLNLNTVNKQLDLTVRAGKQLVDVFAQAGRTKIDFNLGKIEVEANKAASAAQRLATANQKLVATHSAAGHAANQHRSSLGDLTSTFLFVRRAALAFTAVLGVREILDVVKAYDQARQAIAAVFPDDAEKQFAFVREQAERLGIGITDLAGQYAKFSAAARGLGLEQEVVRDNFLAVAEAGAKLGLSSEEIGGALTAIQQIASKGRLSMEELRQQLGDRLPGAITIAAKALGVTEAKLFALVEAGKVASDVFLRVLPPAIRASFGTDAATRIETTSAAVGRFKNGLTDLVDAVVRAGALDAFTNILAELVKLFKDPGFINGLKDFSSALGTVLKTAIDLGPILITLLKVFGSFVALSLAAKGILAVGAAFTVLRTALFATVGALEITAAAMGTTALTAGVAGKAVVGFTGLIQALRLALLNPIVLVVAGLAALDAVLIDRFIDKLDKARDAAQRFNDATRDVESQKKLVTTLYAEAAALDAATNASDVLIKSRKELSFISADGLQQELKDLQNAAKLTDIQTRAINAQALEYKALIQQQKDSGDESAAGAAKLKEYTDQLGKLQIALKGSEEKGRALVKAIKDVKDVSALTAAGIAVLSDESERVVAAFDLAIKAGKGVGEALKQAIPKDLAGQAPQQLRDIAEALTVLKTSAKVTATELNEGLNDALKSLSGKELEQFAIKSQKAFGEAGRDAQALALVLDAQLKAAFENIGISAEDAGAKVSKKFSELVDNFKAISVNVNATGRQIKGALDFAISSAKTKEELELLKKSVTDLGFAGAAMSKTFGDSLLRLNDKLRLVGATMDSALGDSFERLGAKATSVLNALASQATVDFERIKKSGQANALQLEEAFRKFAEQATAANNGIPPINVVLQAVDFNAFDLIVKRAEETTLRTRKAIENAIPLAETKAQLVALSDAIREAFDKGKISVQEFGKLATEVGFKLRDAIAKPVGELAAAADLLGLKTRDQLKATADNAKEAFSTIAASGEFTNQQLAQGATQFLDAYKAANEGVVNSFDPVVAKALEVLAAVNANTEALDQLKSAASEPVTTAFNLKDMGVGELQKFILDTLKAYRSIGVMNAEELQIIKEAQKELARKGQENSDILRAKWEDTAVAVNTNMQQAADSLIGATQGIAGALNPGGATAAGLPKRKGQTAGLGDPNGNSIVVNINGASLSADEVKRKIIPTITKSQQRQR